MKEKEQGKKTSAGTGRRKTSAGPLPPSQEEIARRAHEISVARGGEPGHEVEDWLQAERELVAAARQ
jgi:hypothetical protein